MRPSMVSSLRQSTAPEEECCSRGKTDWPVVRHQEGPTGERTVGRKTKGGRVIARFAAKTATALSGCFPRKMLAAYRCFAREKMARSKVRLGMNWRIRSSGPTLQGTASMGRRGMNQRSEANLAAQSGRRKNLYPIVNRLGASFLSARRSAVIIFAKPTSPKRAAAGGRVERCSGADVRLGDEFTFRKAG